MRLDIYRSAESVYATVGGRFVLDDCEDFRSRVGALLDKDVQRAAVDLKDAEFIDSAGLGGLVGLKVKAHKLGFRFLLVDPSPAVEDILSVSKLKNIFDIVTGTDAESLRVECVHDEFRVESPPGEAAPLDALSDEERRQRIEEKAQQAADALRDRDFELAAEIYQNILRLDPKSLSARNNLAVIYEKKPIWHNKALQEWERVMALSRELGDDSHFKRAQKHISELRRI